MTVTPQKHNSQPGSCNDTSLRSGLVPMDEVEGQRVKQQHSDNSVSLASSLAEPINVEDSHYAQLQEELEYIAQNLEVESWSMAVDQNYMKSLNKEAVRRQDVIYEFIQTEMHHVRTLKILLHVYIYELRRALLIEEAKLDRLFLGVEALLSLHQHFLTSLKHRQKESQLDGSPNNYQITQLGDILVSQFSGAVGERIVGCYSVFCSHHNESIAFYKEQLQNNKKLQVLIKKIGQLPLVRRLGIPECFMLVTQRITKYPILVERIIQNTEADTEEYQSLVHGLSLIKDAISQVNDQVREYEKGARLREISLRLEPKSQGRLKDGQVLRREDLTAETRTLMHEGTVTWKSSGRQKDILALLLSDVVVLLQEKDQKLVFASVDNKPPVISLQRLIVREVAHEDKALFLICTNPSSMPEMYEIHTSSREERITWMTLIREAVERYPEEDLYRDLTAKLQHFQDILRSRDELIQQSLTEKQQIFAALYETVMEQETPHKGLLLRGDTADLQQGETLLMGAIDEVECVQNLLFSRIKDPNHLKEEDKIQNGQLRRAETFGGAESNPTARAMKSDDSDERSHDGEDCPVYRSHSSSDPQLQEVHYSDSPEQSADDDTEMADNNLISSQFPQVEVCDRIILLAQRLYSLQAIIAQQDSQIELQRAFELKSKQPARHYSSMLLEQERQRNLEKHKEELANLHKLQVQHREEQQRWEKEQEWHRIQMEALETQLQQREVECQKWEEKLKEEKAELEQQKENYQEDLERLRESTKTVDKEKDRVNLEKDRLEQMQEKFKKIMTNQGFSNYDEAAQYLSYQSFRGSIANGGATLTLKPHILPSSSDPTETPPKVPPRKESISPQPAKSNLPIQLFSTTNQVHKPVAVQQQIPTKLAALSKGKDKVFKGKGSHQRTHSAASIDVSQLVPIRVTGKEGGSLRSKRNGSPSRIQSGTFNPPGTLRSVKSFQSFSTMKSSSEVPPPAPPPFPTDLETGKDRVIFL